MEASIKFNHLCKQYLLGTHVGGRRSLYQYLFDIVRLKKSREKKTFYSLKNINLTILSGESVGIVGTNGSGKSTLLRVISGITAPSSGECLTRGKVASLLEVGAGFYPELTGRENVYIVASIMGMSRAAIDRQYEEIVELSGLTAAHLDTPVMRYSSGQYMRLAFSISVHVSADIVLVDEILAVGDKKFQKLAITELTRIAQSGKTVIFVSHQHHLIADLCNRVIWMKDGCVVADGPSKEVMRAYLAPEIGVIENVYNLKLLPIMAANASRDTESNIEYHKYYSILESEDAGISFTLKVSLFKLGNWFGELLIDCCYYNDTTAASDVRYSTCIPNMLSSGNYRLEFVCEVHGKPVAATQKEFTVDGTENLDRISQDHQAFLKDFLLVGRGEHEVS